MQAIQITDGRTSLWQWDTGVRIKVYGCAYVDQMHFVTPAGVISKELVNNECDVPDAALQTAGLLQMYAYDRTENGGVTRCDFLLMVKARPKPADYIDPPDEYDNLEELAKRVASLIPGGGGEPVTPEQIQKAVDNYLAENPVQVEETDPTVPGWAKEKEKPTYTAKEVGAQPKGDYALKSDIPAVPVKSVNGKTGTVVLNASDVGALPADAEIVDTTARDGVEANEKAVEKLSKENASLSNKVAAITAPKKVLVAMSFDVEVGYVLLAATGAVHNLGGDHYKVSEALPVTPGEVVIVSAFADYGNMVYVFYDINGNYVDGLRGVGGSVGVEIKDTPIVVPAAAATIRIASNASNPMKIYRYGGDEVQIRKWQDKIWCVIGDSITEKNHTTTMNYHDYVADATGINVINMGVSGTGYAKGAGTGKAFYQRVADVPTNADVVTIFGSGNDIAAGLELGTPTDTGTETLCGCINTTIDNLIAVMPTVSLGIVSTTPWRGGEPHRTDILFAQYCEALKTICEYRSIPFLDLYHCSNLRPWTEEGRAACFSHDGDSGVHPDETGHALIAPRFKAFLETLIL